MQPPVTKIPSEIKRWIEIDLDILAANAAEVRRHLPLRCKLMAVIKANAYGVGSLYAARALEAGVDMFGVTTLEEAVELRLNGIDTPVLVLETAAVADLPCYAKYNIMPAVDSLETLEGFKALAAPLPFHIIVNTGMNRLGSVPAAALAIAAAAQNTENACLSGIFSHLASAANKNKTAAYAQIALFNKTLKQLEEQGINYGTAHIAGSAAIVGMPDCAFDMVRAGTLLYGQSPVPLPEAWKIENPWQAQAKIISISNVPRGQRIGYKGEYAAKKPLRAAVVAIGYADGFALEPQSRPQSFGYALREFAVAIARIIMKKPRHYMFYKNHKLRLLGRISMQLTSIDVTDCDAKVGDAVSFSLRRTSAAPALCRVYKRGGEIVAVESLFADAFAAAKE